MFYFLTFPFKNGQAISGTNIIIEINVQLTYEIISMILSWADDVQVLEPKELIDIIKSKLDNARKKY
ncbi:MAG: hypothetical protein AUJ97_05000 [Bacteroidetes bacterium CG2_30_32_10]|nr:MAG: hypothetical protein AUJ97_05000 [Bacteroidetes bacterium CG2_30_32_10]